MDECRSRGARYLYLDVRASNTVAQSLYASAGFEMVRRRPRYYTKPVEDALVLRCALD
jgi:ribosomal-protein-alanine N-acetyltransferase